ncbi:hypothetical protein AVEN_130532-1 [Araneus ventricosus]|uniref:Uncharacterized protein n=1 Tax=Araneus ventricosus TaxID=182803 RepID=A0A4Y2J6P9_ARAVE|nr:hypothetical protein AVEN_130532-1 [Araneus ventricosus]
MCLQKKKSSGLRSGQRGGQATNPPQPIHREGYLTLKKCRPSCFVDTLRRQVQNDVRSDDLFMLDAFRLYSFLPLRVECDPKFRGNYCSSEWVLSPILFSKNN